MEFEVKTDIAKISEMEIEANFRETYEQLKLMVAPYEKQVVTPDGIQAARKDRAAIRKVSARIDDYRKSIKRQWSEPLTRFEEKCKKLSELCNNAAESLDTQIKGFENEQRREKIEQIHQHFNEAVGDAVPYVTFEDIQNKRWENATFRIEDAFDEVDAALERIQQDVATIKSLQSSHEAELLLRYKSSHDLADIIRHNNAIEEEERKIEEERRAREAEQAEAEEERRKAEEQERLRAEAKAKLQAEVKNAAKEPAVSVEEEPVKHPAAEEEKKFVIRFKVEVTLSQMAALKKCMAENGIIPERI